MKRFVSILLLFAILLASLGVQIIFTMRTRQIRSEMKHYLKQSVPEENLHSFYFKSKDEPHWVRVGKEFQVDGRFYDVVYTEEENGKIHYRCINDVEETALFEGLGQLVAGQLMKDKTTQKGIQLISHLTLYCSTQFVAKSFSRQIDNVVTTPYSFAIISFYQQVSSPPPNYS